MKGVIKILIVVIICFSNSIQSQEYNTKKDSAKDSSKVKQVEWTYEDGAIYAIKNKDSTKWSTKSFKQDLELKLNRSKWPTQSAISDYPSLVSKYRGSVVLGNLKFEMEGKELKGHSIDYANDKYRLKKDSLSIANNYFNILFLTDRSESEASSAHAISRIYPHYMATGKQKTSMGSIDWVHLQRADGDNIALVTQRYFDLKYGKTIIVIPHKDGSVRLLQVDYDLNYYPKSWDKENKNDFYAKLKKDEELIKYLNHPNVIEQQ